MWVGPSAFDRLNSSFAQFLNCGTASITEKDPKGLSKIDFTLSGPTLIINGFGSKAPIRWTKLQKCADGALIEFSKSSSKLHVVESKGTVSTDDWKDIRLQLHGMILNCRAMLGVLQIEFPSDIIFHVALKKDSVLTGGANPILLKNPVGHAKSYGFVGEWRNSLLEFDGYKIPIRKIFKDQQTGHGIGQL